MNYETARELFDAKFPTEYSFGRPSSGKYVFSNVYTDEEGTLVTSGDAVPVPTLSELIEACGLKSENGFYRLDYEDGMWDACAGTADNHSKAQGSTPEEAVARLWLALNKK